MASWEHSVFLDCILEPKPMQIEIGDYERNVQATIVDCYYPKIAIKLTITHNKNVSLAI